MDRPIRSDLEEIMTQTKSQPVQTVATESARAAIGRLAASVRSLRTAALSLLVDRALSA
jgi:hypothetical protein